MPETVKPMCQSGLANKRYMQKIRRKILLKLALKASSHRGTRTILRPGPTNAGWRPIDAGSNEKRFVRVATNKHFHEDTDLYAYHHLRSAGVPVQRTPDGLVVSEGTLESGRGEYSGDIYYIWESE